MNAFFIIFCFFEKLLKISWFFFVLLFLREFGLGVRQTYTQLSDADLDTAIEDITRSNPNGIGYRACYVILQGRGIRVSQEKVAA